MSAWQTVTFLSSLLLPSSSVISSLALLHPPKLELKMRTAKRKCFLSRVLWHLWGWIRSSCVFLNHPLFWALETVSLLGLHPVYLLLLFSQTPGWWLWGPGPGHRCSLASCLIERGKWPRAGKEQSWAGSWYCFLFKYEVCAGQDPVGEVLGAFHLSLNHCHGYKENSWGNYFLGAVWHLVISSPGQESSPVWPSLCWCHLQALACKSIVNPSQDPVFQMLPPLMKDSRICFSESLTASLFSGQLWCEPPSI